MIGTGRAANLIDDHPALPKHHRLLVRHRRGWTLNVPPGGRPRITRNGRILDQRALCDVGVPDRAGGMRVALELGDRARITFGDAVVLAQIVVAPIAPARTLPAELRAGPLGVFGRAADINPAMAVTLLLVAVLHIGAVAWLEHFVPPPPRLAQLSAAVDTWRSIALPEAPPEVAVNATPQPDDASGVAPADAPEQTPERAPTQHTDAPPDRTQAAAADRRSDTDALLLEPARATVASSPLASALRATADGDGPFIAHTDRAPSLRAVDIIGQQTARGSDTGARVSLASADGSVVAPARATLDARSGRVAEAAVAEANEAEQVAAPEIRTRPGRLAQSGADLDDDARALLTREFERNQRDLDRCYTRLTQAQGGTLSGRMVLQVSVGGDGRVSNVTISDNQLGGEMATCVESNARRWRFTATGGAPVALRRPYVFSVGD